MSTSFAAMPGRFAPLRDGTWTEVTLGKSSATVWRIDAGGETLFLKSAPAHPLSEIPGEAARLRWLATVPVRSPLLRDYFQQDEHDWLLMTALPGCNLSQFTGHPDALVVALADALRAVHSLDTATCPFDQSLDVKLSKGAANAAAGLVDEDDFDTAHVGWTAAAVLEVLRSDRPTTEDLVVCHGDASLPNIMADDAGFVGIIDCGRLGVADRWQDLAIACRSIRFNCGEAYIAPFLLAYGASWDEQRFRYYNTLDELF